MKLFLICIVFFSCSNKIKKDILTSNDTLSVLENEIKKNYNVMKFKQSDLRYGVVRLAKDCFEGLTTTDIQKSVSQNYLIEISNDSVTLKNIYLEVYFSNNKIYLDKVYSLAELMLGKPQKMRNCISVSDYWYNDIVLKEDCIIFINAQGVDGGEIKRLLCRK